LAGNLLFLDVGLPEPSGAGEAARQRLPHLLRPYALASLPRPVRASEGHQPRQEDPNREVAVPRPPGRRTPPADPDLELLAEKAAWSNLTCLAGPAERLVPLLRRVKQLRGTTCLADVWPGLTAVLYARRSPAF